MVTRILTYTQRNRWEREGGFEKVTKKKREEGVREIAQLLRTLTALQRT